MLAAKKLKVNFSLFLYDFFIFWLGLNRSLKLDKYPLLLSKELLWELMLPLRRFAARDGFYREPSFALSRLAGV